MPRISRFRPVNHQKTSDASKKTRKEVDTRISSASHPWLTAIGSFFGKLGSLVSSCLPWNWSLFSRTEIEISRPEADSDFSFRGVELYQNEEDKWTSTRKRAGKTGSDDKEKILGKTRKGKEPDLSKADHSPQINDLLEDKASGTYVIKKVEKKENTYLFGIKDKKHIHRKLLKKDENGNFVISNSGKYKGMSLDDFLKENYSQLKPTQFRTIGLEQSSFLEEISKERLKEKYPYFHETTSPLSIFEGSKIDNPYFLSMDSIDPSVVNLNFLVRGKPRSIDLKMKEDGELVWISPHDGKIVPAKELYWLMDLCENPILNEESTELVEPLIIESDDAYRGAWSSDPETGKLLGKILLHIKWIHEDHESIYYDCFGLVNALDFRQVDFEKVTSLKIRPEFELTPDEIQLLVSQLPNLRSLEIAGAKLDKDSLSTIIGSIDSSRISLSLVDCNGTLGEIPSGKLLKLHIDNFEGLKDSDLMQVKDLSDNGLRILSIKGCTELKGSFLDQDLPKRFKNHAKSRVEIYQTVDGNTALNSVKRNQYVSHLRLNNVRFGETEIKALKDNYPNLQSLELEGCEWRLETESKLEFPSVKRLCFVDDKVDVEKVPKLLILFGKVENLELSKYPFEDVSPILRVKESLVSLTVNCEGIERENSHYKEIFSYIESNKRLASINLLGLPKPILHTTLVAHNLVKTGDRKYEIVNETKVEERALNTLNIMGKKDPDIINELFGLNITDKMTQEDLQEITFVKIPDGKAVNAISLQYIAKACPNIERIDIHTKKNLSAADLQAIAMMPSLESLKINGSRIEEPGVIWELRLLSDQLSSLELTPPFDRNRLKGWEVDIAGGYRFTPVEKPLRKKDKFKRRPKSVSPDKYGGLPNLGNTCFLNTSVSQFIHNEHLEYALYHKIDGDELAKEIQSQLRKVAETAWSGKSVPAKEMVELNRLVSKYPSSPIKARGQQDSTVAFDFLIKVLDPPEFHSASFNIFQKPGEEGVRLTMPISEVWTNKLGLKRSGFGLERRFYLHCSDVIRFDMRFNKAKNRGELTDFLKEEYELRDGCLIIPQYECVIEDEKVVVKKIKNYKYKLDAVGISLGEGYDFGHIIARQRILDKNGEEIGSLLRNDDRLTYEKDQPIDYDERALFYIFNRVNDGELVPADAQVQYEMPLSKMKPRTKKNFLKYIKTGNIYV